MDGAKESLRQALERRGLLLDGATGTELTRRGVATPLPLWSAGALRDHPDVVRAIHTDYVAAGADIIVANTFRSNVRTLRDAGLHEQGEALNRVAVELAREATKDVSPDRDNPIWIAASVAPVEDCYCPHLVPNERTLDNEHGRMVAWLAAAGADLIWIETMNTIREAKAAAHAASQAGLPLVISFVVKENGDLLSGEPLEEAIVAVEPFEPVALGLNCIPPSGVTRNLPRLRAATSRPLLAYAHLGNPEPITGWSFSQNITPQAYAKEAARWIELGARIVGGCCGTTPAHIAALRPLTKKFEGPP
ncbi:MAG: homocysteine S-methyltransferase family protein [Planctomycetes bacterium]|nr:homocysteine S-methyltransferase family protein [Planctomycetota bacterium]